MRAMKSTFLALLCTVAAFGGDGFLVKPYLQMGDAPKLARTESVVVVWHAPDEPGNWWMTTDKGTAEKPASQRIAVPGIDPHLVYTASITGLAPGSAFTYTVKKDGEPPFVATGRARKSATQDYRFVIFGDIAQSTPAQREVAYQAYQAKPDAVFVTGDIVYARGRISEYREKYFPVYNADEASPKNGAPLIRSTMFIAAPGNHDTASRDMGSYPDGLAYFLYWRQPLNGVMHRSLTDLKGPEANQAAFKAAAAGRFPKALNYSFDYGNAHWLVLDSNPYVDWSDPELRKWVAADLAAAKGATWKFVGFHHPGFNSSTAHFNDQQMRVIADVFEQGGVDVVFSGHVHNYQRSHPMHFKTGAFDFKKSRVVDGEFNLDKEFDGAKVTKAKGVIYVVTGAGGAGLYDVDQGAQPQTWQSFTSKFVSKINSMTVMDVAGKKATFKQIGADGSTVDSWTLTK